MSDILLDPSEENLSSEEQTIERALRPKTLKDFKVSQRFCVYSSSLLR